MGKYFAEIGDTNLELYFINHLVEISPNHSDYWGVLGNAQYARGYRDIAWESYNKAIELSEIKPGWVLSNIGNLFHSVELYSCAIENLKESLTLDPNSAYSQQRFADATKAKLENHKEWNKKLSEIKVQARSLMDQLA